MRVREIMSENPCTCTRTTSIEEVARLMKDHVCGAIPVINETNGQKPIGMITDRDIVVRILAMGENPLEKRASDAMTGEVVTASPNDSVEDLAHKMERHQVRRVVVVDNGRCVGIVAQADIARRTSHELSGKVVEEISR